MDRSTLKKISSAATFALCAGSCSAAHDGWPSLRTPAERQQLEGVAPVPTPAVASPTLIPPPSPAPQPQPPPDARLEPILTRLKEITHQLDLLDTRATRQKTLLTTAIAQAGAPTPRNPKWTTAQTELTRFNQIIAARTEVQQSVNGLTGQLAVLAAKGSIVVDPLSEAGRLLQRIEAAQAEASATAATARTALSR